MDDLRIESRPQLEHPRMLMAYRGWNDASSSATHALEYIIAQTGAECFGSIDHDEYYDFTQARPYTRPVGEYQRELTWPGNEFYFLRGWGAEDLLIFVGSEPHLRWRRYGQNVVRLAQEFGVTRALALGALLADTPHTRPVPLSGGASTPDMASELKAHGISGSGYEGPTGILSVVGSMLSEVGIPNGSIWSAVPHYISASPNPRASIAMVRHVNTLFGLGIPLTDLEAEVEVYEHQVETAISGNLEALQYVRELELHSPDEGDEADRSKAQGVYDGEPLDPSQAEGLIQSVEEFLRQQRGGTGEYRSDPE